MIARIVGGLWGCFVYLSLSGGSLLLHPSSLPLEDNVVFPLCLDVAVGQVGGHKRKYAAMLQSSSRAIFKVSMMISSFSAPCSSFWVIGGKRSDQTVR